MQRFNWDIDLSTQNLQEFCGNPAQLERSRHAQHIVPVAKDQPGLEGASDEPPNILIANAGVEPVELLISQVAQLPKVSYFRESESKWECTFVYLFDDKSH
jgi:hypothetical protein